jgi:chromosomal replication initiation ATPase DnaA
MDFDAESFPFAAEGRRRGFVCDNEAVDDRSCRDLQPATQKKGASERELSDERFLGSGNFVESVLQESDNKSSINGKPSIDDVLKEVSEESGISREQILGPSRNRRISNARKQFFHIAHERTGATMSMLGRLTGRSHVAVRMAIEEAKTGQLAK